MTIPGIREENFVPLYVKSIDFFDTKLFIFEQELIRTISRNMNKNDDLPEFKLFSYFLVRIN